MRQILAVQNINTRYSDVRIYYKIWQSRIWEYVENNLTPAISNRINIIDAVSIFIDFNVLDLKHNYYLRKNIVQ